MMPRYFFCGKEEKAEREKKKRKIRLEMHNEQIFVDGELGPGPAHR
jgi:hypothetical protein